MRYVRAAVLASVALKVLVLGAWWWSSAAWAEKKDPGVQAEGGVPSDLLTRSRGFRDLLAAVKERGVSLDERERAVATREAVLKDLEKTVAEQVARLESLAAAPVAGGNPPAAQGAPAASAAAGPAVTKIYESMKAEEAGPILDRLDDATVSTILGRMKERKIAEILAAMTRERAVAVTRALTDQRR